MNFLITNMTGFRNKGCEGMTKVIVAEVRRHYPGAGFLIFSNDPDYDGLWLADADTGFSLTPPSSGLGLLLERVHRFYRRLCGPSADPSPFAWADAVISTGGDVFSSEYGGLRRHLHPIHEALRRNKPVCLLGHSIGPFETSEEMRRFARTAERASLITLRESISLKYLKEMGLREPRIEMTADPAFLLPETGQELTEELWHAYGLPVDRPVLAMAVSQGISHYAGLSRRDHFVCLKSAIEFASRRMGFHTLLIPHVQERQVANDDYLLCEQLWREMGMPGDLTVLSHLHAAEEIKGLIGRCALIFAERMHAAIAALSQGVPALVAGYSVKAEGILRDMLGENLERGCLVPIEDCSGPVLRERLAWAAENALTIRNALARSLPCVRERAHANFRLVQEVLRSVMRK